MKIIAIIQARMSSSRLPGKVLVPIDGKTILDYLLTRLKKSKQISEVVVATSSEPSDNAIENHCRGQAVACVRGSLDDVAGRFVQTLRAHPADAFVRVNADSPLLDAAIIDEACARFMAGSFEIISNTANRSYPRGESVEVISSKTYLAAYPRFSTPEHREHVTPYFYENRDQFHLEVMANPYGDESMHSLCIDTPEDLRVFQAILGSLKKPQEEYGWREYLELSKKIRLAGVAA